MSSNVTVKVEYSDSRTRAYAAGLPRAAIRRVTNRAGSTALRDMRSEASKRIRARKRLKVSHITRALTMRRGDGAWALEVSGELVPLVAYPHRQTKKGVSVEVNVGKRTLVAGSFIATMKSGHKGVFRRRGKARLPIKELTGSRPVDALLHEGEAEKVSERGSNSFNATFKRLLAMELGR